MKKSFIRSSRRGRLYYKHNNYHFQEFTWLMTRVRPYVSLVGSSLRSLDFSSGQGREEWLAASFLLLGVEAVLGQPHHLLLFAKFTPFPDPQPSVQETGAWELVSDHPNLVHYRRSALARKSWTTFTLHTFLISQNTAVHVEDVSLLRSTRAPSLLAKLPLSKERLPFSLEQVARHFSYHL